MHDQRTGGKFAHTMIAQTDTFTPKNSFQYVGMSRLLNTDLLFKHTDSGLNLCMHITVLAQSQLNLAFLDDIPGVASETGSVQG